MEKLRECPICHVTPDLDYACGDYFVHCTDECKAPMCDHASRKETVDHWNGWVEEYWQKSGWIDCKEQLPAVAGEYLVVKNHDGYDKDSRVAEWGFDLKSKSMQWLEPDFGFILDGISDWQPLPALPTCK